MAGGKTTRAKAGQLKPLGLPSGQSHKIILSFPKAFVLDIEDEHFHPARAVLLPDPTEGPADDRRVRGLGTIYAALVHGEKHPAQKVLVTGHTDRAGGTKANLELSAARAEMVSCLLRGQRDRFCELAAAHDAVDDVQAVLRWQHRRAGWDCDPGAVDNKLTARTRKAIGRFQELYNAEVEAAAAGSPLVTRIAVDKQVGRETWGAIYDLYMSELMDLLGLAAYDELKARQAAIAAPPGMPAFVGCGEHARVDPARRNAFAAEEHLDEPVQPADRRVEILFFDPGEEVALGCHAEANACDAKACPLYGAVPYQLTPIGIPKGLPVIEANLRLTFVDPEGKIRPFPPGLGVQVLFGDPADPVVNPPEEEPTAPPEDEPEPDLEPAMVGEPTGEAAPPESPEPAVEDEPAASVPVESASPDVPTCLVGAGGSLRFVVPRRARRVFLRFVAGERSCITADPRRLDDQALVSRGEAMDAVCRGRVFLELPARFDTRDGYWRVDGARFEGGGFVGLDDPATLLGTREAPAELQLQVRWQHFRFDYFDRWTSSWTTVPQTRSPGAPVLALRGFRQELGARLPALAEAGAAWALQAGAETIFCLGWVRRGFQLDGAERAIPDERCTAAFTFTGDPIFVRTAGKGAADASRELCRLAPDDAALSPSAARLRYYDLPAEWRSSAYPVRIGKEGIDKIRAFERAVGEATDVSRPFVASLDTIVLGGRSVGTVDEAASWDDSKLTHRFSIYDHELEVHLPDEANREPYFTSLDRLARKPDGPVLHDVPAFTRLISRGADVFDVFDQRLAPAADTLAFPIGARLARRLGLLFARSTPFVSLQPIYAPPSPNGSVGLSSSPAGWSLTGLLRCCGREGEAEAFRIFQRVMLQYDFSPPKERTQFAAKPLATPPADPLATAVRSIAALQERWVGSEADRPRFLVGDPLLAHGSWHLLLSRAAAPADYKSDLAGHIHVAVYQDVRAYMGTGQIVCASADLVPNGDSFALAHELGHVLGLPDEYFNSDYEPSGTYPHITEDERAPGNVYGHDERGMMVTNQRVRSRYFWHLALWAAREGQFAGDASLTVRCGLNRYSAERTDLEANRVYFPVASATNVVARAGRCDLFSYLTGRDQWTSGGLTGTQIGRVDGLIAVRVKMAWTFPEGRSLHAMVTSLKAFDQKVHDALNQHAWLIWQGRHRGKDVRQRVLFSPKYVLRTFPDDLGAAAYLSSIAPPLARPFTAADYATTVDACIARHGVHAEIQVVPDEAEGGRVDASGTIRRAVVRETRFVDDGFAVFCQLVGMRGAGPPTVESLGPLLRQVWEDDGYKDLE